MDYEVHGILISQPSIGDILEIGEDKFYASISPFINNSTSIRLMLWNIGQTNWCKVSDIEVFSLLSQIPNQDFSPLKIIFRNVNIMDYKLMKSSDGRFVLYNKLTDDLLSENEYMEIAEYVRTIVNIHPKVEKAKGKTAREWMIQEDKMNLANRKQNLDND